MADSPCVGAVYLESRLDFLRETQNPDGGWPYFPGKHSWMEPTAYAMLALHGITGAEAPLHRAWNLVRSWQLPDGSTRPGAAIDGGTWVTALAVTLASVRGVYDSNVTRAVDWLIKVAGAEHNIATRIASRLHMLKTKLDVSHEGWPWRDGNSSWIEPTVHALVALKKVAKNYHNPELAHRVREGEDLLFSRRCSDGGWNVGNPNVLNFDLPSYPETTGLALVGLHGRSAQELAAPLDVARRFRADTKSSLAKAWLAIALRCHGENPEPPPDAPRASEDIMLAALQTLAHPDGNHRLFLTEAHT
jgi:hypothetical protein